MPDVVLPLQLAPTALNQPILPNWSFNLFGVNLGHSNDTALEQQVLQRVGSYGRQLGRLSEALEVVIEHLALLDDDRLDERGRDTLRIFLATVAEVRGLKPAAARATTARSSDPETPTASAA